MIKKGIKVKILSGKDKKKEGEVIEIDGVSEEIARVALYKASAKLPIKTKIIKRYL